MKTVGAALGSHLAQTVTTLATIWRITRPDGKEFFFTDHDRDITFEENVYRARSGYNRTAVQNDLSLAVDNLDVEGVFDSEDITEADLRAGLFDYSEVRIGLVNWADPSQGQVKLRRGWLGEVVLTQQGFFRAELRGLTQALSQNIIDVYQPECRADLGDAACGVPVLPPVLEREQEVLAGERYRVPTDTEPGLEYPDLASNGNFDLGLTGAGFTAVLGWTVTAGKWSVRESYEGLTPFDGPKFLHGGTSASGEMRQDVDLLNAGVNGADIDNGDVTLDFSVRRANSLPGDTGQVVVQFLDADKALLSIPYETALEEITPQDVWVERAAAGVALAPGTRYVRVVLRYSRVSGSEANAAFDRVLVTVKDAAAPKESQEIYENRVYLVTGEGVTAETQPEYDTTPGNETEDGTAVLQAEESFMRHATVQSIVDARTFTVIVEEERADEDGWFDGGGAELEVGPNTGKVLEMKTWAAASAKATLFLAPPFPLYPGQRLRLYPGCDKRLDTCADKFENAVNFQGEPFLPGQDEATTYPDANS